MRRHATDPVSLVFGLLFIGVAVVGATDAFSLSGTDVRWLGPGLLVLFGLVLVLGAGFGRGGRTDDATSETDRRDVFEPEDTPQERQDPVEADASGGVDTVEGEGAAQRAGGGEQPPSAEV